MIAFDPLEQINPQPFQLVGADAGCDGLSRLIQIGVDLGLTEPAHRHARDGNGFEQRLAIAGDGDGGVQFMALPGQGAQLLGGLGAAGLLNRRSPSAKVWSAPTTNLPACRAETASAFWRASSTAISPGAESRDDC